MKLAIMVSIFTILQSSSVLSETKQEQYIRYQQITSELLKKSQELTEGEINNVVEHKNAKATFTDCQGKAINPSVVIMPGEYPAELISKYVVFKFTIGKSAIPENIEIIEGDEELADFTKRSLGRSKFETNYATCWLAKYEYKS